MAASALRARWAVLLTLAAVAGACGGGDGAEPEAPADTTPLAATPAEPMDTTPAGTPSPSEAAGGAVTATLTEWAIALSADTVRAGRVVFQVTNAGTVEHALEVEGQGIEQETGRIPAGGSGELTVELSPGTYEVYCPVEDAGGNHQEKGMRTRLVVRG